MAYKMEASSDILAILSAHGINKQTRKKKSFLFMFIME
jgi:hypothetical protein